MEVIIKINGQALSVEVSVEVYEFLDRADHKEENLSHEQRRHWDIREFDEYIVAAEDRTNQETPEQYVCRRETLDELLSMLESCTATQLRRFLLYALDGLSYEQIARLTAAQVHREGIPWRRPEKSFKIFSKQTHETRFSG